MLYTVMRKLSILIILTLVILSHKTSNAEVIDRILAQVGDKIITQYDLDTFAPQLLRNIYAIEYPEEQNRLLLEYKNRARLLLIDDLVLQISAARQGITITEKDIDEMILIASQQNVFFRETVKEILDREKVITPELRIYIRKVMIQEKLRPYMNSKIVITKQDINDYLRAEGEYKGTVTTFDVTLAFFETIEKYKVAKKANDFVKAASEQGSVAEMGWITPDQLIPEIAQKVKIMKSGEISSPIEDENGNIIVAYVSGVKEDTEIPEELYAKAYNAITEKQATMVFDNWVKTNQRSIIISRYDR